MLRKYSFTTSLGLIISSSDSESELDSDSDSDLDSEDEDCGSEDSEAANVSGGMSCHLFINQMVLIYRVRVLIYMKNRK